MKTDPNKPWIKYLYWVRHRCYPGNSPIHQRYYCRGIRCFLTMQDIETLWKRDNAHLLKRASIDRIDSNGNYTIENCRFIEFNLNSVGGGLAAGKIAKLKSLKRLEHFKQVMAKACKRCGQFKPIEDFHKENRKNRNPEARKAKCIKCERIDNIKFNNIKKGRNS